MYKVIHIKVLRTILLQMNACKKCYMIYFDEITSKNPTLQRTKLIAEEYIISYSINFVTS